MNTLREVMRPYVAPFANAVGLPKLTSHAPIVLVAFIGFTVVYYLSSLLSPILAPQVYSKLKRHDRHHWNVHAVSMVHASIVVPWAFYLINFASMPAVDNNRIHGYDSRIGPLQSVSVAYFLWDTIESIIAKAEIGFVLHGIACLVVFTSGYHPFVQYYGPRALMWEASTIFLNPHWFMLKSGYTGSLFVANGVVLLTTFFVSRLIYGTMMSVRMDKDILADPSIPPILSFSMMAGNGILILLNVFWFYKMIDSIKKRLSPSSKKIDA